MRAARLAVLVAVLAGALATACQTEVAGHGLPAAENGSAATPTTSAPPATTPPATTPSATGSPSGSSTATATASAQPSSSAVPPEFAGTWAGPASQPGSTLPRWDALLVLPAGRSTGTFRVGTFCSGTLTVLAADPASLRGREVITADPQSRCATSGTVTLQLTAPGRATMHWVDSNHPDNVADATLTRQ